LPLKIGFDTWYKKNTSNGLPLKIGFDTWYNKNNAPSTNPANLR